MTIFAIAVFVAAYALIASERLPRVVAALAAAGVLLAFGVVDIHDMFYSEETGVDWNVIFLLLGMMTIVGILKQTGIFEYLAIWAAKRSRGRPFRVMAMLCVITAIASAFLDNVTTVLLLVPVTVLVCERLHVPPIPFVIAEVLASNIGGTATLIGDPPNIIVASRADLTFNDFLINLAPIVIGLVVVFLILCRILFRKAFQYDPERIAEVMSLDERAAITDVSLLIRGLAVLGLVLIGFVLHGFLDLEPSAVALLGAGVLVAIARVPAREFLEEIEWETLVFFMGLFVMVGALVKVGIIERLAELASETTQGNLALATMVLLWTSAVFSAIVDNIPYVTAMTPLVDHLVSNAPGGAEQAQVLWWSLLLGADLGGNATAVGASANVVTIGVAKREGVVISFGTFFKYGAVVAFVTVFLSMPYLWFRYLG